ncbi:hypothetical protein ABZZ74_50305 [Streptomyces sp. NPDC006476]|uniref:hypothetical protein n=1 Tax=Streptomyces sp. NPDC006476 TaxID=3157175 RepID=UPI0033BF97F8
MTSRIDRIATEGTGRVFRRLHLADGHWISINTGPAATEFDEVFLFPGLDAPTDEAWEDEDSWEEFLTGGELGRGRLFLGVPADAVRQLITDHGGEHAHQDSD